MWDRRSGLCYLVGESLLSILGRNGLGALNRVLAIDLFETKLLA
jgi:hypothetical protein